MKRAPALPICLAACLPLAACGVPAPPRLAVQPVVQAADWGTPAAAGTASSAPAITVEAPAAVDRAFWTRFGSGRLATLVAEALQGNASLEAMRARVRAARAEARIARAATLPTAGFNAGATHTATNVATATPFANSSGSASLDVAYELDLFGGLRAQSRAGQARAAAAGFDGAALALVTEAEVARTYVTLAAASARLALTDELLADAREVARILAVRAREGSADPLDGDRQVLEVQRLEAERTRLDQARRRSLAALAVLLGREAPGFTLAPEPVESLMVPAVDPGQPALLATRRPDLRSAEARIAAANGDVAAARAAFLPGLRLSANGLGQALSASGPYGWTTALAASLTAPVFQGGRLRGRFEGAGAAQAETVAAYRQALLQALQEGVDALTAVELASRREAAAAAAQASARRATAAALARWRAGAIDMTALVDVRRTEQTARLALIDAHAERLEAAIDLYKALGGAPATTS